MYINTFLYNILFVLVLSSPLGVKHLVVYYLLLRIQHQKHEKHTISSCINNTKNTISLGGSQIKKKEKAWIYSCHSLLPTDKYLLWFISE